MILRVPARRALLPQRNKYFRASSLRCYCAGKSGQHEPLNILFCGADDFSIYSLRALDKLRQQHSDSVASIAVVCRPDKRSGRGLKVVSQVPIKPVTIELGLQLHQLDTFTGWSAPHPFDLVVAVSFGLLVPARILQQAKYGGLNLHPSLLPEFRGAAPIQHALLNRRSVTGVTLQTMHPTRFDHGHVIDQIEVSIPDQSTTQRLVELLGPMGAEMLATNIRDWKFLDAKSVPQVATRPPSYAPKLTKEDRRIDWNEWRADDIVLRDRVLGSLWDTVSYGRCYSAKSAGLDSKRVTFQGPWQVLDQPSTGLNDAGTPVIVSTDDATKLGFSTCDGRIVAPQELTIEGEAKNAGMRRLKHAIKRPN